MQLAHVTRVICGGPGARRPSPVRGELTVILMLVLAGCGVARAASEADFIAACLSSTNFEESLCECLAEKAQKRLSPKSFDFLVASMRKDDSETSRLRAELSFTELMASGTFMANTPAECAGGSAGHAH